MGSVRTLKWAAVASSLTETNSTGTNIANNLILMVFWWQKKQPPENVTTEIEMTNQTTSAKIYKDKSLFGSPEKLPFRQCHYSGEPAICIKRIGYVPNKTEKRLLFTCSSPVLSITCISQCIDFRIIHAKTTVRIKNRCHHRLSSKLRNRFIGDLWFRFHDSNYYKGRHRGFLLWIHCLTHIILSFSMMLCRVLSTDWTKKMLKNATLI